MAHPPRSTSATASRLTRACIRDPRGSPHRASAPRKTWSADVVAKLRIRSSVLAGPDTAPKLRRRPANRWTCRCHRQKTVLPRRKLRRPRAFRSDLGRPAAPSPSGSNARASRPSASRWCRMSRANMRLRPHRSALPPQAHVRRRATLRTAALNADHRRPQRFVATSARPWRHVARWEGAPRRRMPSWRGNRRADNDIGLRSAVC